MDAKLTKSLTDLIDETLQELEELRKSRFAAVEIKLEGPGEGIAGKPSNGDLNAKKSEDEEDKDKEKKSMDKPEDEAEAEEKDEKKSNKMKKKEDRDDDEDDDHDDDDDDEEKEEEKHPFKKETARAAKEILDMHKYEIKKSLEDSESLIKSYVEERVKPLEEKLSTILDLVNKIAEQPVAPKGVTARTAPLLKSTEESYAETFSKAEVANKLFELKKSGTKVDSLDIAKVEMGQDLMTIIKKYNIQ